MWAVERGKGEAVVQAVVRVEGSEEGVGAVVWV